MFNKELFYSLCERYQVEFSEKHDSAMINNGDILTELKDDDVEKYKIKLRELFEF